MKNGRRDPLRALHPQPAGDHHPGRAQEPTGDEGAPEGLRGLRVLRAHARGHGPHRRQEDARLRRGGLRLHHIPSRLAQLDKQQARRGDGEHKGRGRVLQGLLHGPRPPRGEGHLPMGLGPSREQGLLGEGGKGDEGDVDAPNPEGDAHNGEERGRERR